MTPQRIQLKRTKGWKMPPNTVKVDRSTRWGNPFAVGEGPHDEFADARVKTADQAVALFRQLIDDTPMAVECSEVLRGKNLACWCKPGDPCHADVLLEIANADRKEVNEATRGT